MELPEVAELDALTGLERDLLHVFVIGPGQGEGIALALPGGGWILIDGCRAPRQRAREPYPLERVVARFGPDEEVLMAVLTHPHRDHVHGFAELVESLSPRRLAVTGTNGAGEVGQTLADEARACEARRKGSVRGGNTGEALVAAQVLTALRAIDAWEEDHPGMVVGLCDGVEIAAGAAMATVRAPHERLLMQWFDEGQMAQVMAGRANSLSAVIEVSFGSTMVILGGDLPVRDSQGEVPTGWNRVMASHPHLIHHAGFKVPHHGSRDALHRDLIRRPPGRERAWLLTPFNSSSLPRTDDGDGLDILLEQQSPVMLTAPSVSAKLVRAHDDGRVTPKELAAMAPSRPFSHRSFHGGDTVYRRDIELDPLAPVWCVAFDRKGPVARWRGAAAMEVHRLPPGS